MLHTAASSDNPGMGPVTQSETAAAEPDPAELESEGPDVKPADTLRIRPESAAIDAGLGTDTLGPVGAEQLRTIQSELQELEALPEPDVSEVSDASDNNDASEVTDAADEISRPFAASQPTPPAPADLGLSRLVTLPAWSWRKRAAAARKVEQALAARIEAVRRETEAAHAAQLVVWEAQAAEQLEAAVRETRDDAARAAAETSERHEAALAETAERHEVALVAVHAERDAVEARRVKLEQDIPRRLEAVRQEADAEHAAHVATLEAQGAERLEATRRDAEAALSTLAAELEVQATARVEAAVRETNDEGARAAAETREQHEAALAETAEQHEAALAAVHAERDAVEARRVKLEQAIPGRLDAVRRKADAEHAAQVATLEAQAAERLEATRRDTEAALTAVRNELKEADAKHGM